MLNRGIRGRAGLAWSGGNGDMFVISIWFFVFKFVSSLCKGVTNPVTVVTRAKKSVHKEIVFSRKCAGGDKTGSV